METSEHLANLRRDGALLAEAAADAGLDAALPTCPDWRMRDLLTHIGGVHRWATGYVGGGRTAMMDDAEAATVMAAPGDDALLDWFREGHARLVDTLSAAKPDVACWAFLPAPTPLAFWARRQAHETAIHRADAQAATGEVTPYPPDFAADGLDELLRGFFGRPGRVRAEPPRSLHLHATDDDDGNGNREWLVRIDADGVHTSNEHAKGDCAVRASTSDLYLLMWNRRAADGLAVFGNPGVLDFWRAAAHVRWA